MLQGQFYSLTKEKCHCSCGGEGQGPPCCDTCPTFKLCCHGGCCKCQGGCSGFCSGCCKNCCGTSQCTCSKACITTCFTSCLQNLPFMEFCVCNQDCTGQTTITKRRWDLRQRNPVGQGQGQSSMAELNQGRGSSIVQKKGETIDKDDGGPVLGGHFYNRKYPTILWCFQTPCSEQKFYDTVTMGERQFGVFNIPSIPLICGCCKDIEWVVEDNPGHTIGKIKPPKCCQNWLTVENETGKMIYKIKPTSNCSRLCANCGCGSIQYDIVDPMDQLQSKIYVRPTTCVTCCHWRYQIDTDFPPAATQNEKVILLMTSRLFEI